MLLCRLVALVSEIIRAWIDQNDGLPKVLEVLEDIVVLKEHLGWICTAVLVSGVLTFSHVFELLMELFLTCDVVHFLLVVQASDLILLIVIE